MNPRVRKAGSEELKLALSAGVCLEKVLREEGVIDVREGMPFLAIQDLIQGRGHFLSPLPGQWWVNLRTNRLVSRVRRHQNFPRSRLMHSQNFPTKVISLVKVRANVNRVTRFATVVEKV